MTIEDGCNGIVTGHTNSTRGYQSKTGQSEPRWWESSRVEAFRGFSCWSAIISARTARLLGEEDGVMRWGCQNNLYRVTLFTLGRRFNSAFWLYRIRPSSISRSIWRVHHECNSQDIVYSRLHLKYSHCLLKCSITCYITSCNWSFNSLALFPWVSDLRVWNSQNVKGTLNHVILSELFFALADFFLLFLLCFLLSSTKISRSFIFFFVYERNPSIQQLSTYSFPPSTTLIFLLDIAC